MLTQEQKEALQEIANIGMGQAGESIARVLDHFVHLSIPRVLILPPADMAAVLVRTVGGGHVSAVRQAFHSQMRGEAIVIYGEQRCGDLADLMGYEGGLDHAGELELLLDVSNILVGACLGGIAEQLKIDIGFSAPSLMADRVPVEAMLRAEDVSWRNALLVEVNFRLEGRSFACHLVILMPEDEIRSMAGALDRFLEAY
jgi:chemotaxis protein CheC